MANSGLKNYIFSLSPYIEIFFRALYWKNISFFVKFKSNKKNKTPLKDFDKVMDLLKNSGVLEGDILVLHSSFQALEQTKLTPNEVIDRLLCLVGNKGTLVMNSARKFVEDGKYLNYLTHNYNEKATIYNTKKSRVQTGVLPSFMLRHPKAVISRFPLNPIVAIGYKSQKMMENNLIDFATACGKNSAWKFCVDNDAIVVGIGVDLTHSLTIMHVAEDVLDDKWPIKDWYRERTFKVIDDGFEEKIKVRERRPEWGTLHFAERTLCKDLLNKGILKTIVLDGVLIEVIRAKELIDFLNSKNATGYPYYNVKKQFRKWS